MDAIANHHAFYQTKGASRLVLGTAAAPPTVLSRYGRSKTGFGCRPVRSRIGSWPISVMALIEFARSRRACPQRIDQTARTSEN